MYKLTKNDKKYLKLFIDFKQQKPESFPFQITNYDEGRSGHMAKGLRAALAVIYVYNKECGKLTSREMVFKALKKLHFMDYANRPDKNTEWIFIQGVMKSLVEKLNQPVAPQKLCGMIVHECMTLGVIEMSMQLGVNNQNWSVSENEVNILGELIYRSFELLLEIEKNAMVPNLEYEVFPFIGELQEGVRPTFRIGNEMVILNSSSKIPMFGTAWLYESMELLYFTRKKSILIDKITYLSSRYGSILSIDCAKLLGSDGMNKLMRVGTKAVQKELDKLEE